MRSFFRRAATPLCLVALFAAGLIADRQLAPTRAHAQPVPSFVGPYNIDLTTPLITFAAASGTVNSAVQANIDQSGVLCVFDQTAHTGSPSSTLAIQGYDTATNSWFSYVTSGAITADATPTPVLMYPGAVATTVPTGLVLAGLPVPRKWRAQVVSTVGGSGITASVGCNVLK